MRPHKQAACENAQQKWWRILLLLFIIPQRFVNVNKIYTFHSKYCNNYH